MIPLKIGDECPDYIRKYCRIRIEGYEPQCSPCSICKIGKYQICVHCPLDVMLRFREEFRYLLVMKEL